MRGTFDDFAAADFGNAEGGARIMTDVFLSYSSKDRAAAEAVQKSLTARGFDVFWDQEIPPGTDWDTWIRAKLAGAKVVIVLWSHASIASQNVRHEAMIARDAQKIVPVMLDALAPEDFPMGLYLVQGVQLLDWRNAGAKGYERLTAEAAARLGKPAPARPAAKSAGVSPLILFGIVGIIALAGGGLYFWGRSQPHGAASNASAKAAVVAASPSQVATACPGGASQVLGVCPATGAALGPDPKADLVPRPHFSQRILGHWRLSDTQKCREGPTVTLESGQLVFTTPVLRFVHAIEADEGLSVRSRVLEPREQAGHVYQLRPEFFATSDERSFNLIVEDVTAGTRDTWTPCEVKS
jgi:hypothetical protein